MVASVDGLDVIDGRAASRSNSGYVLRPQGELIVKASVRVTLRWHPLPLVDRKMPMLQTQIMVPSKYRCDWYCDLPATVYGRLQTKPQMHLNMHLHPKAFPWIKAFVFPEHYMVVRMLPLFLNEMAS